MNPVSYLRDHLTKPEISEISIFPQKRKQSWLLTRFSSKIPSLAVCRTFRPQRNCPQPDEELAELHLTKRLLTQKRNDKNKLYSLHAPEG
jgi:hypothetical protein